MRRKATRAIHPLDCDCTRCISGHRPSRRAGAVVAGVTRALFLIAVLLAIPFILARAIAGAKGEQR